MRHLKIAVLLAATLLAACSTRSISNVGGSGYGGRNDFYRGELTEDDLIGHPAAAVTEADIAAALKTATPPVPRRSQPLLVIQSGAMAPDPEMVEALKRRQFTAVPFGGQPPKEGEDSYGLRLRLMAAKGGYRQVLCYWGALESATRDHATKLVSWVPIVGAIVPDETQQMRIVLKGMLIDVESGRWRLYRPDPVDDTALSASINRSSSDQDQIIKLKTAGYQALADALGDSAAP
ncbi:hypothetical protein [Zavarzinia sp.]|uniref:hypothetical protein n=1 Tax=Zavarzinia sp. TaxID=2027920 RepID=UPI00356573ED